MDEPGLFAAPDPEPGQQIQLCDICMALEVGTRDMLRASGWISYAGSSVTGKPLDVTICPTCRAKKASRHDSAGHRLEPLPQMHQDLPCADR